MKKEKIQSNKSGIEPVIIPNSLQQETDQEILEQINKRNEENQALKKLLENLNTSFPKSDAKF